MTIHTNHVTNELTSSSDSISINGSPIGGVGVVTSPGTLIASNAFNVINATSNVTIPAGVFTAGQAFIIYNSSTTNITITTSAVTCYYDGNSTVRTSFSLLTKGLCTFIFATATEVAASGKSLS
jgi:hypothetical protein